MGKVKTFEKYEKEIRQFHADGDMDKAHARAAKWSERVPLQFMIANNEQLPYTEELQELGYEVTEMPEKARLGFQQTGDYLCFLPHYERYTGVIWERKSPTDIYGTMVHDLDRFVRECLRMVGMKQFNYMLVGVECTREKFITTGTMSAVKRDMWSTDKNGKKCKRRETVRDSSGNPKLKYSSGATPQSRIALIESIPPRTDYKVNFRWHSARKYAVNDLVRQNQLWLKYHYAEVLKLNDDIN